MSHDDVDRDGRESARDLLDGALRDGRPLRSEVHRPLRRLLDAMALSDQQAWRPDRPGTDDDLLRDQAAAWRSAVGAYRALLAEVRANGVTEAEGVAR